MAPNFSDIAYFIEVSATKNISRAAERLGITQPSLSSAMKRLENSLGVQLLIRSRSGVQLTKAGEEFARRGGSLLLNWEQLKNDVNKRESAVGGEFIIGCHPSVARYSLPYFLPKLLQTYPELQIKLVHDLSRKVTEKVISFEVDFGIVVNPVQHPDLVIKELCTDEVLFWVAKKTSSTQKLGSEERVLICDFNLSQVQELNKKLAKQKINFNRTIQTSSLEVVTELTKSGAGVGIIPRRVATQIKDHGLKVLNDSLPLYKDKICLVYRADAQKTMGADIIIRAIKQAINN